MRVLLMALGFCAVMLAGVLAVFYGVGTDAELYFALQMDAGILADAGISEETLKRLDGALAACLKGDAGALEGLRAEVFGAEQPAFNARELTHMEDCRKLFAALRAAIAVLALGGAAAIAAGARWARDRRKARRATWIAPALLLVPLGLFAGWAALDFNAAFNFFHEMLFTNDLWLLDPRTDLLIRICPQSMFMAMAARIGALGLAWIAAVAGVATLCTRRGREDKGWKR